MPVPGKDPAAGGDAGAGGSPRTGGGGDERFRALFEHAPVGVALCEPDGRFADVNQALRDLLDGTAVDPDRGGLIDLVGHLPAGGAEATAWRQGLIDIRTGRAPVARVELSLALPGTSPRWVQATVALVILGGHRYLLTHVEDSTGRRLAEERLLRLALHDPLTGLASRVLLADRLAAALTRSAANGLPVGVLRLGLDDFTRVNDVLGRQAGDAVLAAVGRRLGAVVRAGDTAGRLGGDEFLVVAGDVVDAAALDELGLRIGRALAEPLDVDRARLSVAASVGGTLARPGDGLTTVTHRAGLAMTEVKRSRRARRTVGVDPPRLILPDDPSLAERPH